MKPKDMPKSPLGRGALATATVAKAGGKALKFYVKKAVSRQEEHAQQQAIFDAELGQTIFEGLSRLRGTALKLAQMLNLEMNILPPELQKKLSQSHYRVPPLNKALVRRVVEKAFGKPIEEVFLTFDLDAFAAASLGQVHRATLRDGRTVAVKVQYPGIKETIASDMKLVTTVIHPILRAKVAKSYLANAAAELEAKLNEETDYLLEAKRGLWFAEHNANPAIVVPRPILDYCRTNVLTAEFIDGLHLDQFVATAPTQAIINRAAQAILDFHASSMLAGQKLHCDPNPGNYLFFPDGRAAVIDFGCVKEYGAEAMSKIMPAIRATVSGDKERVFESMCQLGLDRQNVKTRELFDKYLFPFTLTFRKPHDYDIFDFKQHPTYVDDWTKAIGGALQAGQSLAGFTPETLHIDRTYHGIFRILERLGAEVSFKHPFFYEEEACA